jgi:predicted nucleic acid-binding protein
VWVEFLRQPDHPLSARLEALLDADLARLCGPVIGELLQGAMTGKETAAVEELAESVPLLPVPEKTWFEAGRLARSLRAKGVTVGLMDCLLASVCMSEGCAVLSLDRHFKMISAHVPLSLESVS